MKFSYATNLKDFIPDLSMDGSAAPVLFQNKIYVFFKQFGSNKLKYIIGKPLDVHKGYSWTGVYSVDDHIDGVGVAENTSPCAFVNGGSIHVFYNGSGNNGTWYFKYDGNKWEATRSIKSLIMNMDFAKGTSPSATWDGKYLYVFWVDNGSGDIFYSIKMGDIWTGPISIKKYQSNVGIATGTSPCALIYMGFIYVFYNGAGNDGTFYVKTSKDGWERPVSIKAKIGAMGFAPKTSPAAICNFGPYKLYVTWVGIGKDGIFYSVGDSWTGANWTSQQKLQCPDLTPMTADGTNASGLIMDNLPYVFWHAKGSNSLWMTHGEAERPVPS